MVGGVIQQILRMKLHFQSVVSKWQQFQDNCSGRSSRPTTVSWSNRSEEATLRFNSARSATIFATLTPTTTLGLTMWSAYSTTKLVFMILLLMETSLGRYMPNWFQEGHVTVRWDIMNESSDNYSANITILNYLKNHDIERPWELRWAWPEDEILLSTVGVKGKQHVAVKEKKHGNNSAGGYTINYVKIEPNRCKGCVIPSWFREADLAKSSSSFQINVGRAGIGYNEPRGFGIRYFELPRFVKFTSPRANYICESLFFSSKTRGYMKTWSMRCGRRDKPEKKFNKILNNDD
ncbi:COBRA-like protein 5 isoform X1 [Eutrema salsugineum]|uniref:COBRA-like protein 5 isoform X1 n=1 Tax=Eutrema salsugineum TaxID=72664 RepID=UPI000CED5A83|nr:COBRA-like protein 5 isoform X1 [Eutrema salsugineum]